MKNPDNRKAMIVKVHIAKAQLGMDEASYRTLLARHGAASSADMSDKQLSDLPWYRRRYGRSVGEMAQRKVTCRLCKSTAHYKKLKNAKKVKP